MLLASFVAALAIILLSGCASGPGATTGEIASPAATPTENDLVSPDATPSATPTPEDMASPVATPTDAPPQSAGEAPTPPLMDIAASDARHFKGDPDAPVTIVEFGDFQ